MSNFTRKAVALAYGKNPVPVVTAKGEEDLAWRMIEEARKQGVYHRLPIERKAEA